MIYLFSWFGISSVLYRLWFSFLHLRIQIKGILKVKMFEIQLISIHKLYAAYRSTISMHLPSFLIVFNSLDILFRSSPIHSNSFSCINISCKLNIKIDHQQYWEFKRWFVRCNTSFRNAAGAPNDGHWFGVSVSKCMYTTNPNRLNPFSLFSLSLIQLNHEVCFCR